MPGVEGLRARLKHQQLKWWQWVLGPVAVTVVLAALAVQFMVDGLKGAFA